MPFTESQMQLLEADKDLPADALDATYNPDGDGEHPVITRELWRQAVADEDTIIGYWDWVEYRIEYTLAGGPELEPAKKSEAVNLQTHDRIKKGD